MSSKICRSISGAARSILAASRTSRAYSTGNFTFSLGAFFWKFWSSIPLDAVFLWSSGKYLTWNGMDLCFIRCYLLFISISDLFVLDYWCIGNDCEWLNSGELEWEIKLQFRISMSFWFMFKMFELGWSDARSICLFKQVCEMKWSNLCLMTVLSVSLS